MLYVGLDLSRKSLDFDARLAGGELFERGAVPPHANGLSELVRRLGDVEVLAVIESMNGARFVHDRLELAGWDVRIADAVKAKGLAPLACKTDKIDAWVLAELARRALVAGGRPVVPDCAPQPGSGRCQSNRKCSRGYALAMSMASLSNAWSSSDPLRTHRSESHPSCLERRGGCR